jgi:hypothetical protein
MKKQIAGALAAAALVATPIVWAGSAGAGSVSSYSLTPQSGPAGTVVTAEGTNCPTVGGYLVYVYWTVGEAEYVIINEPSAPNEDETFSVTATIPADAPVGPGDVGVQCYSENNGSQATQHFTFEVTEAPTTTTTAPAAVAAEGVAATPAFTG